MEENKGVHGAEGLDKTCHACGAVYSGHFCPTCGTPAEEYMGSCPVCGVERDGDAKFCINCGFSYIGKKARNAGRAEKRKAKTAPKIFHTTAVMPEREGREPRGVLAPLPHRQRTFWNKKNIIIICAIAALLITGILIAIFANGDGEPQTGNSEFAFFINEDMMSLSVSYVGSAEEGKTVVVPAYHNGKPVTTINNQGFSGKNMTAVELPATIITIEDFAFVNCKQLTSITMDSVTVIGDGAFKGCENLTNVSLRREMVSIGAHAFENCASLTSIVLPGNEDFELGKNAFEQCTGLTSIDLSGLKEIPASAFYKCSALTDIDFGNVKVIGEGAFGNCYRLYSVYLPASVVTVKDDAFRNCIFMTSFTLGSGVADLGVRVLAGCSALETLHVESGNIKYTNDGNNKAIYDSRKDEVVIGIKGFTMEEMIFCVNIAPYAFAYSEITTLDIPNNVEIVGEGAFEGCESLTSVFFGSNFRYLGRNAFKGCTALSYVHLTTTEWCSWNSESDDGTYDPALALSGMDDPVNVANMMRTKENFYYVSSLTGAGEEYSTEVTFTLYVKNKAGAGIGGVSVRLRNVKTGKYTDFAVTDLDGMVTIVAPLYTYDIQVIVPYGYNHEDQYRLTTGEIVLDTMLPEGMTEVFAVILYSETSDQFVYI